jgi:hypothetical protein
MEIKILIRSIRSILMMIFTQNIYDGNIFLSGNGENINCIYYTQPYVLEFRQNLFDHSYY